MNTKHSPAPWHSERHQRFMPHEVGGPGGSYEGVNTWFNLIVSEDPNDPRLRTPIAEITVSTESDANARLITAAPELLEALQEAAELLDLAQSIVEDNRKSDRLFDGCKKARNAIAKATGEPHQ